jgi:hypothetical protein
VTTDALTAFLSRLSGAATRRGHDHQAGGSTIEHMFA